MGSKELVLHICHYLRIMGLVAIPGSDFHAPGLEWPSGYDLLRLLVLLPPVTRTFLLPVRPQGDVFPENNPGDLDGHHQSAVATKVYWYGSDGLEGGLVRPDDLVLWWGLALCTALVSVAKTYP